MQLLSVLLLHTFILAGSLRWSAILTLALFHLVILKSCENLYLTIDPLIKIFQTLAILEIAHALFGLVRSNPLLVFLQITSRLFIVWVTFSHPNQVTNNEATLIMLMAWTITEIIRYTFYSWSLLTKRTLPYLLVWLRYTTFIVLYPLGVTGEVLTTVSASTYLEKWSLFGIPWNSEIIYFNVWHLVILLVLPYFIGFGFLYTHLLNQRKRVLTNLAKETKSTRAAKKTQ